jgi:precorrin-2 dehydrogenase/sirohydrochlorin ferrochelatase
MRYYPVFLDLSSKDTLLVGVGQVGLRKAASLLEAGPRHLCMVDPAADPEALAALFPGAPITVCRREFEDGDIDGKNVVFAATGSRSLNARIADLCADRGVLCNVIDAPDKGDFLVPAHFSQGDLTVALSTGGHSPALARALRQELEAWAGTRYTSALTVLGRLRPMLLELGLPTAENSALFRRLVRSSLIDLLAHKDRAAAQTLLMELLPAPLHARMGELLDGI